MEKNPPTAKVGFWCSETLISLVSWRCWKCCEIRQNRIDQKSFKHTLFSLTVDGSKDQKEWSKRLNDLIAIAPTFEELPEKYRFEVLCVESIIFFSVVEQVDEFGIRHRKKGNTEKYAKGAFQCKLCKWWHSNKTSKKVADHEENCFEIWIFEEWQP